MREEEELGEGSFTGLRSPLILGYSETHPRQAQHLPFIKKKMSFSVARNIINSKSECISLQKMIITCDQRRGKWRKKSLKILP